MTVSPSSATPPAESMVVLRPSGQPVPAQPQAQVFDSWDAFTRSSMQPLGFYLEG